jgi:hypothetical protein
VLLFEKNMGILWVKAIDLFLHYVNAVNVSSLFLLPVIKSFHNSLSVSVILLNKSRRGEHECKRIHSCTKSSSPSVITEVNIHLLRLTLASTADSK